MGKVFVRNPFTGNRRSPERAIGFISSSIGKDDGQGHLAVAKIVSDSLSHNRAV